MSYKDMTFCSGDGCKKFNNCQRALTQEVKKKAKIWWGEGEPPIATFLEPKKLSCYEREKI